ncbi:MAG TPA: hypothetical protein VJU87_00320 [Gemmatimonadaceae bacterium]|nr:hypothetical protein [Gemmatimonadaceae bacterium]
MRHHAPSTHAAPRIPRRRRGVALALALAAIVVIGALIAGAFYSSNNQYRLTRTSGNEPRALAAAELGLNSVITSWTSARTNAIRVGASDSLADTTLAGGTTLKRRWRKLSPTMFWVLATASSDGGNGQLPSQRSLSAVMHIEIPEFKIAGAVMSRGTTGASGNIQISGNDVNPSNWDCPPEGSPTAAIAGNNTSTNVTTTGGCNGGVCLTGTPQIKDTALVADTMSFSNFGVFNYDSLTVLANKVFTTGTTFAQVAPTTTLSGGSLVCNTTDANNWGDTGHVALGTVPGPCESYMPVVWLKGPTQSWTINGNGGGQGILLVDGNLTLQGQFKWTGLIIVKGKVTMSGNGGNGSTGVKVTGAIMAMNRANAGDTFSGTGSVQFSRCVLQTVAGKFATAAPMKYRAWADVF